MLNNKSLILLSALVVVSGANIICIRKINAESRIANGKTAVRGQFPFDALVRPMANGSSRFCGFWRMDTVSKWMSRSTDSRFIWAYWIEPIWTKKKLEEPIQFIAHIQAVNLIHLKHLLEAGTRVTAIGFGRPNRTGPISSTLAIRRIFPHFTCRMCKNFRILRISWWRYLC